MDKLNIEEIELFIFDFDGVLTNNRVYLDEKGNELVQCNRSDGLAFDALRKLNKPVYIISTETNSVVKERAKKLKIKAFTGVEDKSKTIEDISRKNNLNLDNFFYIGNDINDYLAIQLCGYSACPSDSHNLITENVNFVLNAKGGEGVAREILEKIFKLDLVNILYSGEI